MLNSILAKIEANNAGADDALMLDTHRNVIAETNATHIFIVRNGEVATSRVVACPEEELRATVLGICFAETIRCVETDLKPVDVYGADEVFAPARWGRSPASLTSTRA